MDTTKIKSAAHLLIADFWFDLPDNDRQVDWQEFFQRELAQLITDHSRNQYKGYKLVRWIRYRARRLYDMYFKQEYHEQSLRLHYIDKFASATLFVLPYTKEEGMISSQYSEFVHASWLLTALLAN